MKILESNYNQYEYNTDKAGNNDIYHAFNFKNIMKELNDKGIQIDIGSQRIRNGLVYIPIYVAYDDASIDNSNKFAAVVNLYANLSDHKAIALSRSGSDKVTMLTISKVCNDNIMEPFVHDNKLKYKI